MDPTYYLKNFEVVGKDENDDTLELHEVTDAYPNGDWQIDLTDYNAHITYNNDEKKMYMYLNETDYRIYELIIRQIS